MHANTYTQIEEGLSFFGKEAYEKIKNGSFNAKTVWLLVVLIMFSCSLSFEMG